MSDVQLIHGDCLDVLRGMEPGSVDAVVTDPPYGIGLDTNNSRFSGGTAGNIAKRGNGIGSCNGRPIIGDAKPFDPTFLTEFGKCQIIWGWNHYPDKLPRGAVLVWLKRYDEAFGSFLSDAELAWMSKGHGIYCRRDLSNNAIANERVHPTQKPVGLMRWCIERLRLPPDSTILDPYMGSGTTGVAAVQLGYKFIGIEIDAGYFAIAKRRIDEARGVGSLFPPAESSDLFAECA